MKLSVTILAFCVAALLALGLVMLYSASMDEKETRLLAKQLIACGVGVVFCLAATAFDYRRLKKLAWPLFILGVLLLAMVFLPHIGIHRKGATRWLGYGNTALFQPSEFAKLALILVLAWYGDRYQRQMGTWKRGIVYPGLLILTVVGLIFREPDVGSALLIATVSSVMLVVGGARVRYILPPVIIGAIAVGTFIYFNPMRSQRIHSWMHLEETKQAKGLQAYQAMLALGSGGVAGRGLGASTQKYGFLPEHYTDFIFSIIGEELGLVATLLIVLAYVVLVICGLQIAWHAPDSFGLLLGSGLTSLIGLQACINIGVVTGALPNKGLPLPFISYGGSNLLAMLACVGLLLSVARQAQVTEEDSAMPGVGSRSRRSRANPFQIAQPELHAGGSVAAES